MPVVIQDVGTPGKSKGMGSGWVSLRTQLFLPSAVCVGAHGSGVAISMVRGDASLGSWLSSRGII